MAISFISGNEVPNQSNKCKPYASVFLIDCIQTK